MNKLSFSFSSIILIIEFFLLIELLLENKAINDNIDNIICFKLFF